MRDQRNKEIEKRLMLCNNNDELEVISRKIVGELVTKVKERKRL